MKTILLILPFLISYVYSYSSNKDTESALKYGFIFGINTEFLLNTDLNKFLETNNFHKTSDVLSSTYIGFNIRGKKNPSSIRVDFQTGKSINNENNKNSIIYTYGYNLNYSFDLIKGEKWLLAPNLGMKLNSYKLSAISKDIKSVLSGDYLEESFHLDDKFLLNFGFGFNRLISISYFDIFLGLNCYYNIDIHKSSWTNGLNHNLTNIPQINLMNFGLSFVGIIEINWDKISNVR